MYLLSNTQIYKNANYISVKFPFKALKLLTQLSEKPKNKFQIPKISLFKKTNCKFFENIPNFKNINNTKIK